MKIDYLLAGAVIVILIAVVLLIANSTLCDATLRFDENGIQLSDPCGELK